MSASDPHDWPSGSAVAAHGTFGAAATKELLDEASLDCEVLAHDSTFRAVEEARAMAVTLEREGKTVVLRHGDGFLLALVPASRRLDLRKVRRLFEDPRIRLADEREIGARFTRFDVGAIPPIGPLVGAAQVIDRSLLEQPRIACSAGDHEHGLFVSPEELVQLGSWSAEICED